MFSISVVIFGLILFLMGYYFGNQIGRTEHIRQRLLRDRRERRERLRRQQASLELE